MRSVADRIRRARRIKGWSQARLAECLGLTTSAVGHWERPDGHQPSSEHLIEIGKHLSVSLEWLAAGRGEMHFSGSIDSELGISSLNAEEEALLKRYQGLPSPFRALLVQFLEALTASPGAVTESGATRGNERVR